MNEAPTTPYGPRGDASRHRQLAALESGLADLPEAPRDRGHLLGIVRRLADGSREALDATLLTIEDGVPGDAWSRGRRHNPAAQLAVMRSDIAELIANAQPLTLFGDNLFVDLDLDAANLPGGTRLQVGHAVLEVTSKPHNGCAKFAERFGRDALRFVAAKATRPENRRGIYWRVVEPGRAALGDRVLVLRRG